MITDYNLILKEYENKDNRVIAGVSAKKAPTKIETVKHALFYSDEEKKSYLATRNYSNKKIMVFFEVLSNVCLTTSIAFLTMVFILRQDFLFCMVVSMNCSCAHLIFLAFGISFENKVTSLQSEKFEKDWNTFMVNDFRKKG